MINIYWTDSLFEMWQSCCIHRGFVVVQLKKSAVSVHGWQKTSKSVSIALEWSEHSNVWVASASFLEEMLELNLVKFLDYYQLLSYTHFCGHWYLAFATFRFMSRSRPESECVTSIKKDSWMSQRIEIIISFKNVYSCC